MHLKLHKFVGCFQEEFVRGYLFTEEPVLGSLLMVALKLVFVRELRLVLWYCMI